MPHRYHPEQPTSQQWGVRASRRCVVGGSFVRALHTGAEKVKRRSREGKEKRCAVCVQWRRPEVAGQR